jgi:hypothetical protein
VHDVDEFISDLGLFGRSSKNLKHQANINAVFFCKKEQKDFAKTLNAWLEANRNGYGQY